MRLKTLLFAVGIPLLLSACAQNPAPVTEESIASSSVSSSSSSEEIFWSETPFDTTVHDGLFTDATYGFAFRYPTHFEPLTKTESQKKRYGMHFENNALEFSGEKTALASFHSRNRIINADIALYVNIYPLADYTYPNIYTDEYAYDATTDAWKGLMENKPFAPETVSVGTEKAFIFSIGDAGWSSTTYAIPHKQEGVMIEITTGGCPTCWRDQSAEAHYEEVLKQNEAMIAEDTKTILSQFQFIESASSSSL